MPEHILITGAGGFIGSQVAAALLDRDPTLNITLTDRATHPRIEALADRTAFIESDLTAPDAFDKLLGDRPYDLVHHYAGLVSGGAEQHFELGLKLNVLATIHLLEACRKMGHAPRIVIPSSIASFGGADLPNVVDDWTFQHPQGSYGVAKVVGEQLLNDYSRRGWVDGRGVRLAATVVRDDPHAGLSCATSAIVRELIAGRDHTCPLPPEARMPICSIARTVDLLATLGTLDGDQLGDFRTINGPSLSPTLEEIHNAVLATGKQGLGTLTWQPDPEATAIVNSWPDEMKGDRAAGLGFDPDASIDAIVAAYAASTAQERT